MRRKLTEEDKRLWAGATRSVQPLRPGQKLASADPDLSVGGGEGPVAPPREASRPARPGPPTAAPMLAPLPRREKQRLARGVSAIDARIDLHGMTQVQAHAALLRFVQRAQAQEARFVLVITGTGTRGGAGERGVLRRQVPLWLELTEFRRYVLGFESAHIGHGGEGALYVRIRRGKRFAG
jgi:DNA-nicking Smr family endonuclease